MLQVETNGTLTMYASWRSRYSRQPGQKAWNSRPWPIALTDFRPFDIRPSDFADLANPGREPRVVH